MEQTEGRTAMILDGFQRECMEHGYSGQSKDTVAYGTQSMKTNEIPTMIGWICPVCGRGLSPYTCVCPCKNGNGWEITC